MIIHHLKLAFRILQKYKTQNIISIIGLAIGFTCFACSALWIRYEMSYDNFHPKADRIYRVHLIPYKWETSAVNTEIINETPYPLANYLKTNFPEIEDACRITSWVSEDKKIARLCVDQSFCNIFDFSLPEYLFEKGKTERADALINKNFSNIPEHHRIKEYVIKEYNINEQIALPLWSQNTNIPFNLVIPLNQEFDIARYLNEWIWAPVFETYILIIDGADIKALEKKLDKISLPEWQNPVSLVLTPIKQLRYKDPSGNLLSEIKFNHIRIFAIAGLLVILCSLFNHLTLYVTRIQMRLRELALRKVNGATNWQIAAMLYTDFLLVILLSLVAGFMPVACLLPTFKEYADIGNHNISIYFELLIYAVLLLLCGFIAGGIPILFFRKQDLNSSIKGSGSRNLFRRACLLVQLIISLGLMFCSAVFIKQIHFLHHTDLGINRQNIATVWNFVYGQEERLKQIPGIIDVLPVTRNFLRSWSGGIAPLNYEKNEEILTYTLNWIIANPHFFDFFGIEIIEGTGFSKETDGKSVHNETAVKELGDVLLNQNYHIGVARDFYITPTQKVKPVRITYKNDPRHVAFLEVAYKYEEGMRQQTQQAITKWIHEEFPDQAEYGIEFTYLEDVFEEYFKSERALLSLLSVMTLACILIAIFGVYSLANLNCERRRKEIAIRKINGAEVFDVMNIFFKEYLLLLAMAAFVAYPAGYLVMKRWMEGYVKQTTMDAWIYVLIFLTTFFVIVLSIVSMVWEAANKNPAETIKSES